MDERHLEIRKEWRAAALRAYHQLVDLNVELNRYRNLTTVLNSSYSENELALRDENMTALGDTMKYLRDRLQIL